MAASRDARIACIPVLLALALLVVGMQPTVATAQMTDRPDRGPKASQQPLRSPDASTRLPSWAEPNFEQPSGRDQLPSQSPGPITNAPPPGGEPIPVDGGLSLLALAGAGYAARKLRQSSDDDDGADRDDAV